MARDYMGEYVHNIWSQRIDYKYTDGKGLHRYYVIVSCVEDKLSFEFHHLKQGLTANICGKRFYDSFDIPGCPPKKRMGELRELIVNECSYQFRRHQRDWDESLVPTNLY